MDDGRLRLHCPSCRAIGWSRDGFMMTSDVNGGLNRIRVARAILSVAEAPWTCGRCGHQATPASDLERHLSQMQVAHIE